MSRADRRRMGKMKDLNGGGGKFNQNDWKPADLLYVIKSSNMITFRVMTEDGMYQREYFVHKSVACTYFNGAIRHRRGQDGSSLFGDVYRVVEDVYRVVGDPDTFRFIAKWFYTQTLNGPEKPTLEESLILWVHAGLLELPALQNAAIDRYFSLIEYGKALNDPELSGIHDDFFPYHHLPGIWKNTKPEDQLRSVLIHQFAFGFKRSDLSKPEYDNDIPYEFLAEVTIFLGKELVENRMTAWEFWKRAKPSHYYVSVE